MNHKDEALARVLRNSGDWQHKVAQAWEWWLWYAAPAEFSFDEFRYWAESEGISPHHHNAWGAFAREATRNLRLAGYCQSGRPQAKGRLMRMYHR